MYSYLKYLDINLWHAMHVLYILKLWMDELGAGGKRQYFEN